VRRSAPVNFLRGFLCHHIFLSDTYVNKVYRVNFVYMIHNGLTDAALHLLTRHIVNFVYIPS